MFPFILICILTFFLQKMPMAKVKEALSDTFKQCLGAAVAPIIGELGAFMSVSSTVSNALFAGL